MSASVAIWIAKGDERNRLERCERKDMNSVGECRHGISGLGSGG